MTACLRALALVAAVAVPGYAAEVWLFGDSITRLYCDDFQWAYPEWNVTCLGIDGERTPSGRARLRHELATRRPLPNVVVIEEGVNDVGALFDRAGARACSDREKARRMIARTRDVVGDLAGMIDDVLAANPHVVPFATSTVYHATCPPDVAPVCRRSRPRRWAHPLASPTRRRAACTKIGCIRWLACNLDARILAMDVRTIALPAIRTSDFLHPDVDGQALMAAVVGEAIRPYLPTP